MTHYLSPLSGSAPDEVAFAAAIELAAEAQAGVEAWLEAHGAQDAPLRALRTQDDAPLRRALRRWLGALQAVTQARRRLPQRESSFRQGGVWKGYASALKSAKGIPRRGKCLVSGVERGQAGVL